MALQLRAPPIVEVVCGFSFPAIQGLDPVMIGQFWAAKRGAFPKRELHPPILDRQGFAFLEGVGPIRVWLVSENDEYLMQIQPDRFYFNWRKGSGEYPRFKDYDGKPGVLSQGLATFRDFTAFCAKELGHPPVVSRLELAKISLLLQPQHWADPRDLARVLPVIAPLVALTEADDPTIQMRLSEVRGDLEINLSLANAAFGPSFQPALRLESRASKAQRGEDVEGELVALNEVANKMFFGLVPHDELHRFGGTVP
jgi:uncharacterized protein (TIGR04255 family)